MSGRSLQCWSQCHEEYTGLDENETYHFRGIAHYPWEGLGYYRKPETLYEEVDPKEVMNKPGKGFTEPLDLQANPFYRYREYGGFISQGFIREMVIPPKHPPNVHIGGTEETDDDDEEETTEGETTTSTNTTTTEEEVKDVPITVAREQILKDGTIIKESARGIHLVKHINIRSFERKKEIDDPKGDDQKNNGYEGSTLTSALSYEDNPTDEMLSAVRIRGLAGFREHTGDFDELTKREDMLNERDVITVDILDLLKKLGLASTAETKIDVDEDQKNAVYYSGRASFSITNKGNIYLRNAYGAEIALVGPSVYQSGPGALMSNFGQSIINLAGDDIVHRAKSSVDITATDNDVRIKAEHNLDLVGGMKDYGRVLIESKSEGTQTLDEVKEREGEEIAGHGIVLKAKDATTTMIGKNVYVRSLEGGQIVLDANNRGSDLVISARNVEMSLATSLLVGIDYNSDNQNIGENLLFVGRTRTISKGNIESFGSIYAQNTVRADQGISISPSQHFSMPEEYPLTAWFEDLQTNFVLGLVALDERYWKEGMIGHEDTIDAYTFSYRRDNQYGNADKLLQVPYWIELYGEETLEALATWDEKEYFYQDVYPQMPWPGYQVWTQEAFMEIVKPKLYDGNTGRDKDLIEDEEETGETQTAQEEEKKTPAELFRVMET